MYELGPMTGSVHPQIMKFSVEKGKLKKLLEQFQQWKNDYSQMLQRYDIKFQHNRERQVMLNAEHVR
jgi:hypothetical protein